MLRRKLIIPTLIIVIAAMISLSSIRSVGATGDTIYFTPSNTPAAASGNIITITVMADTVGASPTSGFNGWDLVITANDPAQTNLMPTSVSIAGNLFSSMGTVGELVNCVNGGAGIPSGQPGNSFCDARDGPGVVHTSGAFAGNAPSTPVSGQIAKIAYTIAGPGPLTIGILSPCPPSIFGSCDIVSDGSLVPVPHKTLTATYGTLTPPGDFRMSMPNGTSAPAPINPGASGTTTVNVTSLSGAAGSVSFSKTTYPLTGLNFACSSVTLVANMRASSACTFSSNIPGTYLVTVNATNTGSPNTFHLAPIPIIISDFKATAFPTSLGILKGNNTAFANITATSLNGFSGSLAISGTAKAPPPATGGLTVSCNPTTIMITPTTSGTSKCTFTAITSNKYTVTLTANYTFTGGFVARTATVSVAVQSFQITASPGLVRISAGLTGSSTVTVSSFPSNLGIYGFSGSVAITTTRNDTRLGFSCPTLSGQTVTVTPTISPSGNCTFTPAGVGNFALNVTGTFTKGGITITNSTKIVIIESSDFTVGVSAAFMSPGIVGNSTISVTGFGITTPVLLTYNVPSGLNCPSRPASITPNNTAVLACSAAGVGIYNVSITARNQFLTHVYIASFTVGPDIAITKVTVAPTTARVGDKVTVTVTIKFNGTSSPFEIQIRWAQNAVGTPITVARQSFNATGPGPTDYTVVWDTSGLNPGTGTISAYIPPLTSPNYQETTLADNIAIGPSFTLQAAQSPFLSGVTLYAIIAAIVAAAAGAGAFIFLRRRRKAAPTTTPTAPS